MDDFVRLNTIFLPSRKLQESALKLAAKITKGRETLFYIDDKVYISHLTIYSPEYPINNQTKVYLAITKLAAKSKPLKFEFDSFYKGWGYVGIGFKKTREIEKLHKKVLETLNPLREGYLREKYPKEIAEGKYPPEQVKYISDYGYHNILNAYEPHLTLTRFKDEDLADQIADELNKTTSIPASLITKLAVCEMGPHGTCTKILKVFSLG